MDEVKTELSVEFGHDVHRRTVVWPILKSTDKAWLLVTTGGEIWMPIWRWKHIRSSQDSVRLKQICDLFTDLSVTHGDARVSVRKAGRGATDKSYSVAFSVRVKDAVRSDWEPAVKDRTAIVPISQLLPDADGGWTLPRWVLQSKLNQSRELLAGRSVWAGLALVMAQLQVAFDAASASVTTAIATSQVREEAKQKEFEVEKARIRSLAEEDGEMALAFARRRLSLSDISRLGPSVNSWPTWLPATPMDDAIARELARLVEAVRKHPDFASWREKNLMKRGLLLKPPRPPVPPRPRVPDRVIEDCTVEWTEWIGTSRNQRAVKHRDDGCTVRVFGKKHEIELPDGSVVSKMAGSNLRVTARGTHCQASAQSTEHLKPVGCVTELRMLAETLTASDRINE